MVDGVVYLTLGCKVTRNCSNKVFVTGWHNSQGPQPSQAYIPGPRRTAAIVTLHGSCKFYETQFPTFKGEFPTFDLASPLRIRSDQHLCYQGFQGNADLYGLGIRIGIYLQWVASLLSNNLLPGNRTEFQQIYLLFSNPIYVAALILSLFDSCAFSIEVEILY